MFDSQGMTWTRGATLLAGLFSLTFFALACTDGQTGSEVTDPIRFYSGCSTDSECVTVLKRYVDEMREAPGVPFAVGAANCEPAAREGACRRPQSCECAFWLDTGIHKTLIVTLGLAATSSGCDHFGRSGQCLISSAEFAGCAPGDPCSCWSACEGAMARIARDTARDLVVEGRHAECNEKRCQAVLSIDGKCHVLESSFDAPVYGRPSNPTYDCALPNDEILRRVSSMDAGANDDGGTTDAAQSCAVGHNGVSIHFYDAGPFVDGGWPVDCPGPEATP